MAEKYLEYYNEFAVEDNDDIITICQTAGKIIWERFRARFDDPKLLAATFSKIYGSIMSKLKDLEREYQDFNINICGRLDMGYSTNEDEDDEKQGNFMVYIRHLNSRHKNDQIDDPQAKATERAVLWNAENCTVNPDILRKISVEALDALKEIDVNLGSSELVMPVFVTVYESLVNFLKIRRREKDDFEYEINFISCFYISARESEDEDDVINIRPNIEAKLTLKDDAGASSKYE